MKILKGDTTEFLYTLDDPAALIVHALEFPSAAGDQRAQQVRHIRFFDLFSSSRMSAAERAAECERAGLLPAGLLAPLGSRSTAAILFGVTRQGVGKALRQGSRGSRPTPRTPRAPTPEQRGRAVQALTHAGVGAGETTAPAAPNPKRPLSPVHSPRTASPPRRTAQRRRPSDDPATQINLPLFPVLASNGDPS